MCVCVCVCVCVCFLLFFSFPFFFRCLTFNGMLYLHVHVIVCRSFPIYKHGKGFPSGVSIFKRQYKSFEYIQL